MADPPTPPEPAAPTGLTKTMARIGSYVGQPLEMIMFLVLASYAVVSITEISARSTFLGHLQGLINSINQELAQNESPAEGEGSNSRGLASERLLRYESSHARLVALISTGADDPKQTLAAIRRRSEGRGEGEGAGRGLLMYFVLSYIFTLNSDHLLAIAIMTCGAIGATIASIRKTRHLTWRSVFLGLAAGFIVFLSIKGGRHIFLIQTQGQMAQFNPYSSAFLGLIAGMFTERTFELLGAATDAVFKKIKKVLEE